MAHDLSLPTADHGQASTHANADALAHSEPWRDVSTPLSQDGRFATSCDTRLLTDVYDSMLMASNILTTTLTTPITSQYRNHTPSFRPQQI